MKKKNKKFFAGIAIIAVILIIIFLIYIISVTGSTEILVCYKERNLNESVLQIREIEFVKGRESISLKENHKIAIDDIAHNKLISKGYDTKQVFMIYSLSLKNELKNKLHEYGDIAEITSDYTDNELTVSVEYKIEEKNKEKIEELFNFDFFKKTTKELKSFFEGEEFKCELK